MADARAVSVAQILTKKMKVLEFENQFKKAFGNPEPRGSWIIWGNSGNGKTRFALQLARYLASFGKRIAYNSLEEGVSVTMRNAIKECNIADVKSRFVLLNREPLPELIERLRKKKSADVILIDSIQYAGMTYATYKALVDQFRSKLFILVSHSEGRHPAGRVARSIRFDADIKIWVEGYRAYPVSRYGGGEPFTIWEEGAISYESKNQKS